MNSPHSDQDVSVKQEAEDIRILHMAVGKEEVSPEERSHGLLQEEAESPHFKEGQEELNENREQLLQRPDLSSHCSEIEVELEFDTEVTGHSGFLEMNPPDSARDVSVEQAPVDIAFGEEPEEISIRPESEDISVKSLQKMPFERRTVQAKLRIKELGPDKPAVIITQKTKDRGREYTRTFSKSWYDKKAWLTACGHSNALFCFPCLLFQTAGSDPSWIKTGVNDIRHFTTKSEQHEQTSAHIENSVKLAMFGKVNINGQLSVGYRLGFRQHNEEVNKNRQILSKIIDCVKSCGAFELAQRGHDERVDSANSDFLGLVNSVASPDAVAHEHLHCATVFKGMSNTIQNELLDCMLRVAREHITQEIQSADLVAIQADETTSVSTPSQVVIVFRYIDRAHVVQERFFDFVPLQSATAASVSTALLDRLSSILPKDQRKKLIAQAYGGASVMRGGVIEKVQEVYEYAHHVHCYAHHLGLIMQQATSRISKVRQFFSDLDGFASFFSRSPRRTSVLDRVVAHRLQGASTVTWDFHDRAVNTVFEHKDDLLRCFETIRDSDEFDPTAVREAGGFVRLLEDDEFKFFLGMFHRIMPHVDLLYRRLQEKNIDSVVVQDSLQALTKKMQEIRDSVPTLCGEHSRAVSQPGLSKKRRTLGTDELQRIATEVCDIIVIHAKERFSFTKHLISATLLQSHRFHQYRNRFPEAALNATVEAYPTLNKSKLRTELSHIYGHRGFKDCRGALALYQFIMRNDLRSTFSETAALLNILITTPMSTAEPERCFTTLQRIRTFLADAPPPEDRLSAAAMISMERKLVKEIPDFNRRVIDRFANLKERWATFMYRT